MSQEYLLYSNVSALSGQVPSSCWSCIQNLECVRTSSSETCHRRPHPQCGIDLSIQNTAVNGVTERLRIWLRWIHGFAQVFHLKTVGFSLFFKCLNVIVLFTILPSLDEPTASAPANSHCNGPKLQSFIGHRPKRLKNLKPSKWCSFHFISKVKPWLSKMHHFFLPCSIEAVSNNLCVSVRSGKQQLLPVAFESCSANCIV